MAGRRLLDFAKLFNASRTVVNQHIALRSKQLDTYNKTSTLAKAVKNQTDRVTLTLKAAAVLAGRLNETGPSATAEQVPKQNLKHDVKQDVETSTRPAEPAVAGPESYLAKAKQEEGIAQDHHYDRSPENSAVQPPPASSFEPAQTQPGRYPLPDGTIPPEESDLGQPTRDKVEIPERPISEPPKQVLEGQQQEAFEPAQVKPDRFPLPDGTIPPEGAKLGQPARDEVETAKRPSLEPQKQVLEADQGIRPVESSESTIPLPSQDRVKSEGRQEVDPGTAAVRTNVQGSTSTAEAEPTTVPDHVAVPAQDEVPEGINTDVFHSSKVSQLLSGKKRENPYLKLRGVKNTPVDKTPLAQNHDQDTFNVRSSEETKPTEPEVDVSKPAEPIAQKSEDDASKLAADIASEVKASGSLSEIAPELAVSEDKPAYQLRESRVPSSRFGRLWQYTGLGASMAFGAVGEGLRRVTGGGIPGSSLMLSPANIERLVAKLSRMRGAALKMGQMLSFQDSKLLPATIQEILQRVQDSADYMPASQRDKVLRNDLGPDWRDLFSSFDEVPMAAASIGQVHKAVLKSTGQAVAVKVQYPGVANSIDSDLNNLSVLLTASRLLPRGLFLDKTIANARTELAWECDYIREAEWAKRFRTALADDADTFTVPNIIDEASGKQVLTAELMEGTGITKPNLRLTQEQRDWIGTQILRLCLREVTEFKFMQTDPNWTNFLFNAKTNKLELLDFGASREYPNEFIDPYIGILNAASINDRDTCRDLSIQLGYLTGRESQAMVDAHVTSVLTLAEPFSRSSPEVYDFRDQTITERVKAQIPVMLRERLAPPPEETYSLHRKLSGAFLLCARLGSRVPCRELFENAMSKYEEGGAADGSAA